MSIKIVITADLCPTIKEDHFVEDEILAGKAKELISPVFPVFEKADLVIANLETAVTDVHTPIDKCGPNLAMQTETLKRIKEDMGIDAFTLANNHIGDHGFDGIKSTVAELKKLDIPYCGADVTHEEACKPMTFKIKNKSIAVFNFAEGEYCQAQYNGPGTARLDPFFAQKRVMDVRDKFDYIITILHVGNEHLAIPSPETVNVCRSMAAAGSDVVIGHHAHIPQMLEIYNGVPVCFSLGNFLFGQKFNPAKAGWHTCTIADITLADDGVKAEMLPYRQLEDLHLHEFGEKGSELLSRYFADCLDILYDEEKYRKIWEQEARSKFGGNIAEGFASCFVNLLKAEGEERKKEAKLFYNIFNCTTHRERMATGLRLIYDDNDANDEESQAVIDNLEKTFDKIINEK